MDSTSLFDPAGQEGAIAPSDRLTLMKKKLHEAIELDTLVDRMEEDLKAAKSNLHNMRTIVLPDLLTQCGMPEFLDQETNQQVILDDFVAGSLPKDAEKRAIAVAELEANEGGGILVTDIVLRFSKSEHNVAVALAEDLKAKEFDPVVTTGVNPQTFLAFVRARLKDGKPIDLEKLGVFSGKIVKWSPVKEKKSARGRK